MIPRSHSFRFPVPFHSWSVAVALVIATALGVGCSSDAAGNDRKSPPAEPSAAPAPSAAPPSYKPGDPRLRFIKTAMVEKGVPGGLTAATGRIAFDEDHTSRVGSPVSGRVDQILVKPGDRVRKGQVLLTIASADVEGALSEARMAATDLALAQRTLERAQDLYGEHAIAKKELLQAESDTDKAHSNLERTRGRLDLLGLNPEDHTSRFALRAPVTGTVVERTVLPGAEVRSDAGGSLVTISDLGTLWAYADVFERDLAQVHAGLGADVRVASYGNRAFPGRVAHVGDVVDPQTRTVKVRLVVDNRGGELKPDMFARIALAASTTDEMVVVPRNAVLSDGESSVVIVDRGGNRFEKRKVELGPSEMSSGAGSGTNDHWVPITAGVNPGDWVVTDGALFLKSELENQ